MHTPTPLMVANLIDNERKDWQVDMINDIFSETDAILILNIYLCQKRLPDKLIWWDSAIGLFIVKSTYYVARKVLGKEVHQQANKYKVWKLIWKAKVIPKVKLFA